MREDEIEKDRHHKAGDHHDKRREFHPSRHIMNRMENMIVLGSEECTLPEIAIFFADKDAMESETSEQRAETEKRERHEHHERGFMRLMCVMVVIMPMGVVIIMAV